jgi:hypothetical protein
VNAIVVVVDAPVTPSTIVITEVKVDELNRGVVGVPEIVVDTPFKVENVRPGGRMPENVKDLWGVNELDSATPSNEELTLIDWLPRGDWVKATLTGNI